jgi:hypothetical protein
MLNIISHQGNANQNYNEISSHPSQNGYCKKKKSKILVRLWRKATLTSYIVGGNVKPHEEEYGGGVLKNLKNLKVELPYDSAIPLLGTFPKEMKCLHTYVLLQH